MPTEMRLEAWFTANDVAGAPGMPASVRRTRDRLRELQVPERRQRGREGGGGSEFNCAELGPELVAFGMARRNPAGSCVSPASVVTSPAVREQAIASSLLDSSMTRPPSDADRRVADARLLLIKAAQDLAIVHGIRRSCEMLSTRLATKEATPELLTAATDANRRARSLFVSVRTLFRWIGLYDASGWSALLPHVPTPSDEVDEDVAATLGAYLSRDPKFRQLTDAAKEINRTLGRHPDAWVSLYHRARRALPRIHNVEVIKARHLGAQRAAKLPFKRRDTGNLHSNEVWLIDGHTFKAKVRHPIHGAPFAPEVTVCIDAASRLVCGWSVSLSENTLAVGDALRHAVGRCGVPMIAYTDNGAGQTGRQIDCPIAGLMARLDIEHHVGRPGHPQGRGLIERSWQSHMIQAARMFGSYQGSDVDPTTFRHVAAQLAKEQRALKRAQTTGEVVALSPKAPTWEQFMETVAQTIDLYNKEQRHSALPRDAEGKHCTPAVAWERMLDPQRHRRLAEADLKTLFMPAELRTAKRGEVQLFNNIYASPDLMAVDGQQVRCQYDIHDASYLLVYTTEGKFVCEAKHGANLVDFFPKAVIERVREKRVRSALKRLDERRELAMREVQVVLDASRTDTTVLAPIRQPATAETVVARPVVTAPVPVSAAATRPIVFETGSDRYEWLLAHRDAWIEVDGPWLQKFIRSEDYRDLLPYYRARGLVWSEDSAAAVIPDSHPIPSTPDHSEENPS